LNKCFEKLKTVTEKGWYSSGSDPWLSGFQIPTVFIALPLDTISAFKGFSLI
jgi:hypothetical protein